ncbi:MAG: HEAT repeat domain-containing protein [Planctomycetota bacterium]
MHGIEKSRAAAATFLLTLTTGLATALPAQANSLATELRAKEIERRLNAIDKLGDSNDPTAEKLLGPLLRDKDWEVQERAAAALGALKSTASLTKLVELATDGEIARVRRAAAQAIAAIDATGGAERVFDRVKGKRQVEALEALALVLRGRGTFADLDKLQRLMRDEAPAIREAAAMAWFEGTSDRAAAVGTLLASPSLIITCRMLESIAEAPRAEDLAPLAKALGGEGLHEVVARRLLQALAAVLAAGEGDRAKNALQVLDGAGSADLTLARRARLVPLLSRGKTPVLSQEQAVAALQPTLGSSSGRTRAAAAKALREVGGSAALKAALAHFERDPDPVVQWQLVETVNSLREPTVDGATEWLMKIVANDYDRSVRERAIVALGRTGVRGATATLVKALDDRDWRLACCAAVSLGKTDADDAFAPLQKLLQDADWKRRGAAIVGLMHWSRDAAVDPLLERLEDENAVVARAAHEALRTMSRNYAATPDAKKWRKWWADNRASHDFTDREAALDKLKKYGYAVPDSEVYQGLDVIVLTSDGDHIEKLLDRLEIAHRETKANQVPATGLHPEAIFVANCWGHLEEGDVAPLTWFVYTGGSLFGSCWALTETIGRIEPDVMRMFQTKKQVLDNVRARPCRSDSALLTGVFPPSVVPIYHLEGAHLIQVLDQERCEVLIDSPDAAERHGCGNLAAWFVAGHGVMFDSANHFDLQGLGVVEGLKTATDRQAFAIDHLGMPLATWRETRNAGYWKHPTKALESVPDLSAFRLLTNFVRSKRTGQY